MGGYIGNIPVPQGTQTRQNFTATASQTSFPTIGYTAGFIDVYLNGVKLINGTDFTATNGSDVVLTTAASVSDVLDVVIFDTFNTSSGTFSNTTLKNNVTLKNDTEEDSDGGRASKIIYQGEQSGGEITTLAEIEASHDGTSDDQKGDLIFRTNDGSDNNAPTERMRIASDGNIGIGISPSALTDASGTANVQLGGTFVTHFDIDGKGTSVLANNKFYDGSNNRALFAGESSDYLQFSGVHTFRTAASASAGGTATLTERVRIDSNGLKFNGDTAAANALDDYETGSFQMSVAGVSGGARGSGIYVKIGNLVHFQWYSGGMTVTSATPVITGLPFTSTDPHNNAAYSGFVAFHNTYVSNANTGYINLNSTSLYFTALNSTGGPSINTGSNIYCMVSGTYYAA